MRPRLGRLTLGALMLAAAALSTDARDARADQQEPAVLQALEALRTKRYQDALTLCAPSPTGGETSDQCPLIRAHALNELGRHLEAYEALRASAALGSKDQAAAARETFRSALLSHLARVTVTCSAEGPARVTVNGKPAKSCPTNGYIVTAPGEILIEVRKEGFEVATTKIQAAAGESVTARVDLVPSSASSPASPAAPPKNENAEETDSDNKPATETALPTIPTPDARASSPDAEAARRSAAAQTQKTPETPRGIPSPWSCKKGCWVFVSLGILAVGATTVTIIAAAASNRSPTDIGDISPGQIKVPLHAW